MHHFNRKSSIPEACICCVFVGVIYHFDIFRRSEIYIARLLPVVMIF